jgi:hypothetical protein
MIDQLHKISSYPCSQCGKKYSVDDMVEIEKLLVCFNCKPIFLQRIREGVAIFPKTSRAKWWKIYFFIILALQLLSFIISFQNLLAGENLIESILEFVVNPWILVAIFGYSFNKKFLIRRVWEMLFPVAIITDFIVFYVVFTGQNSPEDANMILIGYVILSPLIIFQYIALYRYGFSKTERWT